MTFQYAAHNSILNSFIINSKLYLVVDFFFLSCSILYDISEPDSQLILLGFDQCSNLTPQLTLRARGRVHRCGPGTLNLLPIEKCIRSFLQIFKNSRKHFGLSSLLKGVGNFCLALSCMNSNIYERGIFIIINLIYV